MKNDYSKYLEDIRKIEEGVKQSLDFLIESGDGYITLTDVKGALGNLLEGLHVEPDCSVLWEDLERRIVFLEVSANIKFRG